MRLINTTKLDTGKFEIQEFQDDNIPNYAILSHTWKEEEVTLRDMQSPHAPNLKGYAKIDQSCSLARAAGLEYLWVDTCCIDKSSSAELSEAINSMYRWYQEAEVCYAYLADVPSMDEFLTSRWFTRGWTLQELIAPPKVVFLDQDWKELGTKESLQDVISERTGIPVDVLTGTVVDFETISIAQRMSWAAGRRTTRTEDVAYSLLGIFGISMPLLYGEGQKAFIRLQEEIMKVSDDSSIFAWRSNNEENAHCGLLATSPDVYKDSADVIRSINSHFATKSPWSVDNKGLHLELPFMAVGHRGLGLAILDCTVLGQEDLSVAIYLRDIDLTMERFERVWCDKLELNTLMYFRRTGFPVKKICVVQRRLTGTRRRKPRFAKGEEPPTKLDIQRTAGVELFGDLSPIRTLDNIVQRLNLEDKNERTPLSYAAEAGNLEEILSLLARPDLTDLMADLQDEISRTPLSYAAEAGYVKAVWLLLSRPNIRVNSRDAYDRTPLSYAAEGGHSEVVWLLLSQSDIEAFPMDRQGLAPLTYAAKKGHTAVISTFLALEDIREKLKDLKAREGRTLLSHAAEGGDRATVEMLLAKIDSEQPNEADRNGATPLGWAAGNGHLAVVELLLAHGADPNHHSIFGSPLKLAAQGGHETTVSFLLAQGAHVESGKAGGGPLAEAIMYGCEGTVEALLNYDADADSHQLSEPPIHIAAKTGKEGILRRLLARGADVETRNSLGWTALLLAASNGKEATTRVLLEHGADVNVMDASGTPLHMAAMNGHEAVIKLLLEHGADLTLKDRWSKVPLQCAAKSVKALIENHSKSASPCP